MKPKILLALAGVFLFSILISCTEGDPVVIYNNSNTDAPQGPAGTVTALEDTVEAGVTFATVCGQVRLSDQELAVVSCGIIWGTDEELVWDNKVAAAACNVQDDKTYCVKMTPLMPGTKYYYRFYLHHGPSFGFGPVESFTTEPLQLETCDASNIGPTEACFSGRVNLTPAEMDSAAFGVLWSTDSEPTWLNKASYAIYSPKDSDLFAAEASWLIPDTRYYYRSFLRIDSLYEYGPAKSFTTAPGSASTETLTVNGVSYRLVAVEGGTFWMGCDSTYDNEKPMHQVTLSSYHIGQTEVTQQLWEAVMGTNPSEFRGDSLPVEKVSWEDCQAFIQKLNQQTGKTFRLPTEAEWEYAARGGRHSQGCIYAGADMLSYVAWFGDNSGEQTHKVAIKDPNELGLYDMSGNVWEWCHDWYDAEWYAVSPQVNPSGPSSGIYHVGRGGCWSNGESFCRVTRRLYDSPAKSFCNVGFRIAL